MLTGRGGATRSRDRPQPLWPAGGQAREDFVPETVYWDAGVRGQAAASMARLMGISLRRQPEGLQPGGSSSQASKSTGCRRR